MAGYSVRMTDAIGGVSNGAYSVEKENNCFYKSNTRMDPTLFLQNTANTIAHS